LQQRLAEILREALPSVVPRLEREAEAIKTEAVKAWPVQDRTKGRASQRARKGEPHSRDLFNVETVVGPTYVEIRLVNAAPYIYYIKSGQNGLGFKHAWTQLIRTPARKRAKVLAEELRDDVTKLAGK